MDKDGLKAAEMPMPAEGTAAADALAANAAKPVTRFNKMYKRSKRKPPTKTNLDGAEKIVPGKLITRENDMYVMSIGMMLGLRVSLMYNAANVDEDITNDDMHAGDHYVFPPEGNLKSGYPATPKHHLSHTFKFKDYAPKVFHRLRLLMGVDTKRYMNSVSGNVNYVQFTSNSKSGQFFFFTPDGDYMIKTVSHEEVKELLHIMPEYYNYLKDQPGSFLCRVTGMYRVQMYHLQRTVYFIVMASAYKGAKGPMDTQYDCKGSHVGRNADPGDSVRKDNDLLDDGFRLMLGKNREPVMSQLRRDVEFLRDLGFLDYSVLIGARNARIVNNAVTQLAVSSSMSSNSLKANNQNSLNSLASIGSGNSLTSNDVEGVTSGVSELTDEDGSGSEDESDGGASEDVEMSLKQLEDEEIKNKQAAVAAASTKNKKSFGMMRFMKSSSRAPSLESGIDDSAAAEMAASMLKMPTENANGDGADGGGRSSVFGQDENGNRKSVELIADKIFGKASDRLSVGGSIGSGGGGGPLVPVGEGQPLNNIASSRPTSTPPPVTRARKSSGATMSAAAAAAATRKKMSRRVSSRTIQFEYTKKWEAGIAHPLTLNEEAELAHEIRNRLSTVSMIDLNQNDGLPACPPPSDAPWVIPTKMNASFEEFLSREGGRSASLVGDKNGGGGSGGVSRVSETVGGDDGEGEEFMFASPLRGNAAVLKGSSDSSNKQGSGGGGSAHERVGGGMDHLDNTTTTSNSGVSKEPVIEEYRLGVIDFLTKYGVSKMAERNFKSFKYEKKALSVAPPDEYAARLIAFMEGIIIGDAPPAEANGGYLIEITLKEANAISSLEVANSVDGVISSRAEEQWLRASSRNTIIASNKLMEQTTDSNTRLSSGSSATAAAAATALQLKGTIISSVKDGSEPWRCGVRVGDRIHRINGELIPQALNCRQVSDRMKKASRPVYITLERLPTALKKSPTPVAVSANTTSTSSTTITTTTTTTTTVASTVDAETSSNSVHAMQLQETSKKTSRKLEVHLDQPSSLSPPTSPPPPPPSMVDATPIATHHTLPIEEKEDKGRSNVDQGLSSDLSHVAEVVVLTSSSYSQEDISRGKDSDDEKPFKVIASSSADVAVSSALDSLQAIMGEKKSSASVS